VTQSLPFDAESRPTSLDELERLAHECQNCDLYRHATQVVVGEGSPDAELMLMGEQPGDKEDLEGAPFVGPAGRVLDRALEEAGIDRGAVYVTNAVKHFKFERRGKVRLHKKPGATEIRACRPWWEAELEIVHPRVLCCLGATAAQAVFGGTYRVSKEHGRFREIGSGIEATATIHPSAVLRANDDQREAAFEGLVGDLVLVAERIT
jgi:uracil-DNA glycosylase